MITAAAPVLSLIPDLSEKMTSEGFNMTSLALCFAVSGSRSSSILSKIDSSQGVRGVGSIVSTGSICLFSIVLRASARACLGPVATLGIQPISRLRALCTGCVSGIVRSLVMCFGPLVSVLIGSEACGFPLLPFRLQ